MKRMVKNQSIKKTEREYPMKRVLKAINTTISNELSRGGFDDVEQVRNAGVAPHATVKIEEVKTGNLGYESIGQHLARKIK